jgi:hypothetical protein
MKEREYNNLLNEISIKAFSVNQLLYQIIILISIYYYISNISNRYWYISKNNKSILFLYVIFAVGIDWLIWNNIIQTSLFIAILVVYINNNLNNLDVISTFINITNQINESEQLSDILLNKCNQPGAIPELISLPYDTKISSEKLIHAYDNKDISTKAINEVYKPGTPYLSIVDSNYSKIMLNELYNTPQYKNISDKNTSLNNDDEKILNLLRNPKREFLDSSWLNMNMKPTYNNKITIPTSNGKDAICNIVKFGKKLEQCTNQENSITKQQLDSISSNEIPSMDF